MKSSEPRAKLTLMGQLLKKVQSARWMAKRDAAEALWKKNGLDNPTKRAEYRMIEESSVTRDGAEVTTLKLWKLVDKSIVTLESSINVEVKEGRDRGDEYSERATPANDNSSPI